MAVEKIIVDRNQVALARTNVISFVPQMSCIQSVHEEESTKDIEDFSRTQLEVFCDFDGTIADDSYDTILEHLADPQWKIYEELWQTGKITGQEYLSKQIPLIRGSWSDITKVLQTVQIDPFFKSFVTLCRRASIPVYVVSSGLDKVIHYLLEREGIEVDGVWASRFFQLEDNTWSAAEFPHSQSKDFCRLLAGSCKCAVLESCRTANASRRIVIGDGRSDFCWVRQADIVFAKSSLAKHCHEENIDFMQFSSFLDIGRYVKQHAMLHTVPVEKNKFQVSHLSLLEDVRQNNLPCLNKSQ